MSKDQPAGMLSFFLVNLCLISQNNKQLLLFFKLEAECMATIKARKEALRIPHFLFALKYKLLGYLVSLRADNKRTILLTANPEFH